MGEEAEPSPSSPISIHGSHHDHALSQSQAMTREEVIRRRRRRVKQLSKLYRDQYWVLMEEIKAKYREYCWVYGRSPYKEEEEQRQKQQQQDGTAQSDAIVKVDDDVDRCAVGGCKAKAMALTRFCHSHILSDSKQKLYKGCTYVIRSAPAGPILCGKPILRSTVPSLCPPHFQKNEKLVNSALKKAGFNVSPSNRASPKFEKNRQKTGKLTGVKKE